MPHTLTCSHCGASFESTQPGAKYCSSRCKWAARLKRQTTTEEGRRNLKETKRRAYLKRQDYYQERQRDYRAANPDAHRTCVRRWKAANPDKVVAHIGAYRVRRQERLRDQSDGTAGTAVEALLKQSTCLYCNARLESVDQKVIDHMQPVALGGLHSASNLALSCIPCNTSKAASPFTEWIDSLPPEGRARAVRYWTRLNGAPPNQLSLLMPVEPPPRVVWTEADAKRAWRWWIETGAPDWWLDGYWANHPKPWLDKRLTDAEAEAVKYRANAAHREYHVRGKPSRQPEYRRKQRVRQKMLTKWAVALNRCGRQEWPHE